MSIPSGDLFTNRFFNFIVGEDKKEFVVHANVFARLSRPIHVLINGPFTEAEEGHAVWDDVTEETFKRFIQFAYCGDYECIEPKSACESESNDDELQLAQVGSIIAMLLQGNFIPKVRPLRSNGFRWILPYCIHDMYRDKKMNQTISITRIRPSNNQYREFRYHDGRVATVDALIKWYSELGLATAYNQRIRKDTLGTQTCENIREIIFYHAELYILADKYRIKELARLATAKMGKLLHTMRWTRESIRHIADLIPYVFKNTMPEDMMRETLVWYVSIVVDDLYEDNQFSEVLKDVPEFSYGILRKLIKYRVLKD
ncbi:hypothetical protein ABKA04_009285 [Annulohypoxylon sp. FPYF3050]